MCGNRLETPICQCKRYSKNLSAEPRIPDPGTGPRTRIPYLKAYAFSVCEPVNQ